MDRVCPLLGLAADSRSVVDGVDPGHRCYAEEIPIPLDRRQQAQVCLTAAHERCERFLQHAIRTGGIRPRRTPIADGLVTTRLVLDPRPAWRGFAGRARRAGPGRLGIAGLAVVLLLAGGAAVASGALDGPPAAEVNPDATPSPDPTPLPSATATLAPTPSPTATPVPTPVPTVVPTPAPTAAPTPVPVRTYIVQAGDNLSAIAANFGSTVAAIQAANGIEDPNEIFVGQVLVIP